MCTSEDVSRCCLGREDVASIMAQFQYAVKAAVQVISNLLQLAAQTTIQGSKRSCDHDDQARGAQARPGQPRIAAQATLQQDAQPWPGQGGSASRRQYRAPHHSTPTASLLANRSHLANHRHVRRYRFVVVRRHNGQRDGQVSGGLAHLSQQRQQWQMGPLPLRP